MYRQHLQLHKGGILDSMSYLSQILYPGKGTNCCNCWEMVTFSQRPSNVTSTAVGASGTLVREQN